MFVDIENPKSPLAIENLLIPYKRGRLAADKKSYLPKEPITPQVCWKVLKSTNCPRNIKDMLQCITELSPSEQAQFKDIVLSVFECREQPDTIVEIGRCLAQQNGYVNKFNFACKIKDKSFLLSASSKSYGYLTRAEDVEYVFAEDAEKVCCLSSNPILLGSLLAEDNEYEKKLPAVLDFPNTSELNLDNRNLDGVRKINLKEGATLSLLGVKNLSPSLDLSHCGKIIVNDVSILGGLHYNPETVMFVADGTSFNENLSAFSELKLTDAYMENVSSIKLKDGVKIHFEERSSIIKGIDFSQCSELDMEGCHLNKLSDLPLRKGVKINLKSALDLPKNIDFSQCNEVNLARCYLEKQSRLRFKNGAKVNLSDAVHLPDDIDFSQCSEIDLSSVNLENQPHLCFKNGAKVNLSMASNFPANVDFSVCDELRFECCDLKDMRGLHFKDGAKVYLKQIENLPDYVDFSHCSEVEINFCDFKGIHNLHFRPGAKVKLFDVAHLPDNIDFSQCSEVKLNFCDLKNQQDLRFKSGAVVDLSNAKNLPLNLDFSGCDSVYLMSCSLKKGTTISIEGVKSVYFAYSENLPATLDFSNCDNIDLSNCDLSNRNDLHFKKGSWVDLNQTVITQPFLDLSDCETIKLDASNKIYSPEVLFRDYLQRDTACHTWIGSNKLFYTSNMDDEEALEFKQKGAEKNKSFSNNLKQQFSQFLYKALKGNNK